MGFIERRKRKEKNLLSIPGHAKYATFPFPFRRIICCFVRFWGEDDMDRVSVTSRKMITYTRVDCVGASKGLFFGLLILVSALICLILFFVLIDHGELHVSQVSYIFYTYFGCEFVTN